MNLNWVAQGSVLKEMDQEGAKGCPQYNRTSFRKTKMYSFVVGYCLLYCRCFAKTLRVVLVGYWQYWQNYLNEWAQVNNHLKDIPWMVDYENTEIHKNKWPIPLRPYSVLIEPINSLVFIGVIHKWRRHKGERKGKKISHLNELLLAAEEKKLFEVLAYI